MRLIQRPFLRCDVGLFVLECTFVTVEGVGGQMLQQLPANEPSSFYQGYSSSELHVGRLPYFLLMH